MTTLPAKEHGLHPIDEKLYEALAARQHSIWAHWMTFMFDQGTINDDGTWTMPAEKVERWQRQMNAQYSALSEPEKDSDREQAEHLWPLIIRWYVEMQMKTVIVWEAVRTEYQKEVRGQMTEKPQNTLSAEDLIAIRPLALRNKIIAAMEACADKVAKRDHFIERIENMVMSAEGYAINGQVELELSSYHSDSDYLADALAESS